MAATPDVLQEEQTVFWHDVADTMSKVGGISATGSLHAAYEANVRRIADFLAAFHLERDQVGLLAFVGESVLGLDIVGAPRLYARVHERLLRGYVLDAIENASAHTRSQHAPKAAVPQRYLDIVRAAPRLPAPTVGKGMYHVMSSVSASSVASCSTTSGA